MDGGPGEADAADGVPEEPVVLFDGVCNLCNGVVQFVIPRDPEATLRFAPLQSDVGRALLARCEYDGDALDSIVVVEGEDCYAESDAALRVARHLSAPYRWLWALRVLPRPLRDAVYRVVADHRYEVFGRREECMVPSPGVRSRFLAFSTEE